MASFQWQYNDRFLSQLRTAVENKMSLGFVLGRIDDIDIIRDHYGLVSCDPALLTIEAYLKSRFRDYTMRRGDEFYVLVFGQDARAVAESIRIAVPNLTPLHPETKITMSFGVYEGAGLITASPTIDMLNLLRNRAEQVILEGQRRTMANRVY